MQKNSFTSKIKKEIIQKPKKIKEIQVFMDGFLFAISHIHKNPSYLEFQVKDPLVFKHVENFLKKLKWDFTTKGNLWKTITIDENPYFNIREIDFNKYHNVMSLFFAGFFYATGSVSNLDKTSYYLELSSKNEGILLQIQTFLNQYNFNFKYKKQQNKSFIYLRSSDTLLEFLSAIEAIRAYSHFLDLKISRDMKNTVNRINNLDFANLQKIAKVSIDYISYILYVFEHNLENHFSENEMVFFRLRLENPEFSLNQIREKLESEHNIFISKSGLNHWNIKLKKVVEDHKTTQLS